MEEHTLQELFGSIDIYVFDQLLKGRFFSGMRVLDAGCGTGRNLVYFLRNGYEVFGVDQSAESISQVRQLASVLAPHLPAENFRVEPIEAMTFGMDQQSANNDRLDKEGFDVVISSAVLHFARDEKHWQTMVDEMWRVLKPGGIFFARLASTIGIEQQVRLIEGRRYHLPDGSDRFLVDGEMLRSATSSLGGEFLEPIKTTVVENLRAMTTWVIRKSGQWAGSSCGLSTNFTS
ncbi:MAG TPA: class I SAM-dependent methyltransferase [Pyrinomonadaceae bacterium]|jgi:SAM-dependent methyltransferase|nr:class I SAM-dependent methyltransferase [Pyrinomonadaceae bacterium]